jgi:hypothetical protein
MPAAVFDNEHTLILRIAAIVWPTPRSSAVAHHRPTTLGQRLTCYSAEPSCRVLCSTN